jgi:hypothetical protein
LQLASQPATIQDGCMNETPKICIVGKRRPSKYGQGGVQAADNLLQLVRTLRKGRSLAPRGVYRFKSHEEADEWMMKMLTRPGAARPR